MAPAKPGTRLTTLPCGAITAEPTWLLPAPGRAIHGRQRKEQPPEREQRWAPTELGFDGAFDGTHTKSDHQGVECRSVSGDTEFLPGVSLIQTLHKLRGIAEESDATLIFGADPEQVRHLRLAPGVYA